NILRGNWCGCCEDLGVDNSGLGIDGGAADVFRGVGIWKLGKIEETSVNFILSDHGPRAISADADARQGPRYCNDAERENLAFHSVEAVESLKFAIVGDAIHMLSIRRR